LLDKLVTSGGDVYHRRAEGAAIIRWRFDEVLNQNNNWNGKLNLTYIRKIERKKEIAISIKKIKP